MFYLRVTFVAFCLRHHKILSYLNCIFKVCFHLYGLPRFLFATKGLVNSMATNTLLFSASIIQQLSSKASALSSYLCDNKHAEMKRQTRSLVDLVVITWYLLHHLGNNSFQHLVMVSQLLLWPYIYPYVLVRVIESRKRFCQAVLELPFLQNNVKNLKTLLNFKCSIDKGPIE